LAIDSPKFWPSFYQKIGHRFTKKLVIVLPKNWSSSPKNWSSFYQKIGHHHQKIGHRFTKKLVIVLPKNWSSFYQKIGHRFTKKLVIVLPKNWSLVDLTLVALIHQNFGLSFFRDLKIICQKIGQSFAKGHFHLLTNWSFAKGHFFESI